VKQSPFLLQHAGAPYRAAQAAWGPRGWTVLPLPPGRKCEPPAGFTGRAGGTPTAEQTQAWLATNAGGNAALRLPAGVLGLDVDAYSGKRGHLTWAEHCRRFGEPPPTWTITSREDGLSGIRLFRHSGSSRYRSALEGGDVDLIHMTHRYAVLPPSLHPEGRTYLLLGPSGAPTADVPRPTDLPHLPSAWDAALLPAVRKKRDRPRVSGTVAHADLPRPVDAELVERAGALIASGEAKILRDRLGLTLDDMAPLVGISRRRLGHLEAGRLRTPRPHQLEAYMRLLEAAQAPTQ
jgi:hypothetical protein